MKYAPSLPARNFTCLTRLDHERVRGLLTAELSKILGRRLSNTTVRNVMVLGNHSKTLVPYLEKVEVELEDGSRHRLQDVVPPSTDFSEVIATVKNRGAQVIALRKLSSALSAAQAVARHLRYWLADPSVHTPIDDFMSMGVLSNGNNYGIPEGLMFSMPCVRSSDAPCGYTLAEGLTIPAEIVAETIAELQEERAEAEAIVGDLSIHNSRL
jgi:malate dehydrogenase